MDTNNYTTYCEKPFRGPFIKCQLITYDCSDGAFLREQSQDIIIGQGKPPILHFLSLLSIGTLLSAFTKY